MGTPDVFTIDFDWIIGIGLTMSWQRSNYGRTLDIGIYIPFMYIGIFCRKVKENGWFNAGVIRR